MLPDVAARSVSAAAGVPAVSPTPSRPTVEENTRGLDAPDVAARRSACHPAFVITFPSVEETLYGSTRRARKSRATGSGWAARIRSDRYRWRRFCAHAACSASQRSTVQRVVPRPLSTVAALTRSSY